MPRDHEPPNAIQKRAKRPARREITVNQRPKQGPILYPFFDPMRGYDHEGKWMGMTPEEVEKWLADWRQLSKLMLWEPPKDARPT